MKPTFDVRIGALRSIDSDPAAGPTVLAVDRDVDVPIDVARVRMAERSGVAVGDNCTLSLGLAATPTAVFTGTVVEVRPSVTGTTVVAAGTMQAMVDLRVAVFYSDSTVGAIARDLAGRAGLTPAAVDEGPLLPRFAVDVRRSAYEQLRDLATRFGLDLFADHAGRLVLRALGPAGGLAAAADQAATAGLAAATSSLRYGADVLRARGSRRRPAWDAVTVGGESPASTRGRTAVPWLTTNEGDVRGEAGSGDRHLLMVDPLARTKDLARDVADGTLNHAARAAHVVRITVPGRPDLDLGDDASPTAMPDELLGGSGRIRRLRHRLDTASGFTTTVTVALPAETLGVEL